MGLARSVAHLGAPAADALPRAGAAPASAGREPNVIYITFTPYPMVVGGSRHPMVVGKDLGAPASDLEIILVP